MSDNAHSNDYSLLSLILPKGSDAPVIEAIGKAWDQPRANNESNRGRARNRRVEFEIVQQEPAASEITKDQAQKSVPKKIEKKSPPKPQKPQVRPPIPQGPLKK